MPPEDLILLIRLIEKHVDGNFSQFASEVVAQQGSPQQPSHRDGTIPTGSHVYWWVLRPSLAAPASPWHLLASAVA